MAALYPSSAGRVGNILGAYPTHPVNVYQPTEVPSTRGDISTNRPSFARVLIADPEPIMSEGLNAIFSRQADMQVVGQAACGQEALDLFCTLRPDVLVMEAEFPDIRGKDLIATLLSQFPAAAALVFSHHAEEETIYRALQAGAKGYYLKDADATILVEAVWHVCAGHRVLPACVSEKLAECLRKEVLTTREQEVLEQIVAGCSIQEIAGRLLIGEGTVKAHVNNILKKMGCNDRTQAVVTALRRGLVSL